MASSGEPAWDALLAFHAVVEEGSFSAAARRLGLAQPTVRRQVEALERQVGKPLFSRGTTGLLPTEAALRALTAVREMDAAARAFLRLAAADAGGGRVRISASEIVAAHVLPAAMAELLDRHPLLTAEIVASDTLDDLLAREADIAIRMVRPTQAALVARLVARVEIGFYAARSYADRRGIPATPDEMVNRHGFVGQDRLGTIRDGLEAAGLFLDGMASAVRTDSDVVQLGAIRAGAGIGLCQIGIASRMPDLVRVLPQLSASLEAWLAVHEDLRRDPLIATVYDHLAGTLPRLFAGAA